MRFRTLVAVALVVCLASAAAAQFGRGFGFGFRSRFPPRFPKADTFGQGFNFCRGIYTSTRGEAGGQGWSTDYPDADLNFSTRLGELTKTTISRQANGDPNHFVIRISDPALFQCPILSATDVGTAFFTDAEAVTLRAYLEKGGFLWVDDFWGPYAWDNWVSNISKVLPPGEYPIRDIALDHPIRRMLFEFKDLPQIPSINYWNQSGGDTSERGELSAEPHLRGIADQQGRFMVIMTHNYMRDLDYLDQALGRRLAYIGVLGPGERLERLLKDLADRGRYPDEHDRAVLHGPAGLDIGAEGPVEIAWSIMGEILAVRRGKKGGFLRDRKGPASLREYDPPTSRATGERSR